MKRKLFFNRPKNVNLLLQRRQVPSALRKKIVGKMALTIEQMSKDEKVELFQQLEIAQGIRIGERSTKALSSTSIAIIKKYESMPKSQKSIYAESVKDQVFHSLKKSISEG